MQRKIIAINTKSNNYMEKRIKRVIIIARIADTKNRTKDYCNRLTG